MGLHKSKHLSSKPSSSAAILTLGAIFGALIFVPTLSDPGFTSEPTNTSRSYSFDTANELTGQFISTGVTTRVSQQLTGGIANSGAVIIANADSVNTNAVFKAKDGYSLGPVGSKYTFDGYFKSKGLNGWGGMGFTTQDTVVTTGTPEGITRPNDAIGISIAGGGFRFHWPNQIGEDLTAWSGTVPTGQIASSCANPVHRDQTTTVVGSWWTYPESIACASVDGWYKLTLDIERTGNREFKLRARLFASNADGILRDEIPGTADVIDPLADRWVAFTVPDNSPFITQPQMFSYFNLSGQRFEKFDGYGVSLSGGATVVTAGNPVVTTVSATLSGEAVDLLGNVTSENGSEVTERGFVYSTSPGPTISSSKLVQGSGPGAFTATTPTLSPGTYYFRSFATNGNGTSYGVEVSREVLAIITPPSTPGTPTVTAGNASATLSWTPSSTGTAPINYTVETIPSGGTCVVAGSGAGTTASCSGLTNGVEYQFRVTASNGPSSSATSGTSTAVTPTAPPAPAVVPTPTAPPAAPQPSHVDVSPVGENLRVATTPQAPAGVTKYIIKLTPSGKSCEILSSTSHCDIKDVRPGVDYKLVVIAANSVGQSEPRTLGRRVFLGPTGWMQLSRQASFDNFAGNSAKAKKAINKKVARFSNGQSTAAHYTCVGFAAGTVASERVFALATARAREVCQELNTRISGATYDLQARVPGSKMTGANRKVVVRTYTPFSK